MMRPDDEIPCVYLCHQPIDFRKGINTLAILVESTLSLNPFSTQLFVFINRRRDAIKILYWERNGFCLWQKRLEQDRFYWPIEEDDIIALTGQQLNWLLDGYNIEIMKPHSELKYSTLI